MLIGCLATAACMICLGDKLPNGVLILVMLAAALAAGALWGFLPSFFKAKWNTNETLFTLDVYKRQVLPPRHISVFQCNIIPRNRTPYK